MCASGHTELAITPLLAVYLSIYLSFAVQELRAVSEAKMAMLLKAQQGQGGTAMFRSKMLRGHCLRVSAVHGLRRMGSV